jgi:16S rRNA (adenine(1408)-N(1))-methyltransferase
MLNIVKGKNILEMNGSDLKSLINGYENIVIDIGTGDGKFVYNQARKNPDNFYIGIDSSINLLEDISIKIYKKESRGGLKNIIFIQMPIEEISEELNGIADIIYVNFPWGSLLSGIVRGEEIVLRNIRNIAKSLENVSLYIYLTYNPSFEPDFIEEKDLPHLSYEYIDTILREKFKNFEIEIKEINTLEVNEAKKLTSWAKKILSQRRREVYEIKAEIQSSS